MNVLTDVQSWKESEITKFNPFILQIRKPRSRDTMWLAQYHSISTRKGFGNSRLCTKNKKARLYLLLLASWTIVSSTIPHWIPDTTIHLCCAFSLKETVKYTTDCISLNVWVAWELKAKWVGLPCLILALVWEEVPKVKPRSLSKWGL